jgi:hypothetical protein
MNEAAAGGCDGPVAKLAAAAAGADGAGREAKAAGAKAAAADTTTKTTATTAEVGVLGGPSPLEPPSVPATDTVCEAAAAGTKAPPSVPAIGAVCKAAAAGTKAKTATGGQLEGKTKASTRTTDDMKWRAMGGEGAGFNTNTKRRTGGHGRGIRGHRHEQQTT